MSGGMKQLQMNTRERVVSADFNRAQLFKGADIAEYLRYAMDVSGNDDLDAGAVVTEYSTLNSPMNAEIVNGLLVRPQVGVGVTAVSVDPGVMLAIQPDSDTDSSNYKYVHDAGLATGTITIAVNASGSDRVDVVECQLVDTPTETATRDVYVPSTSSFAPTTVTKARQSVLTYRVRQGTPGSGYPGSASGWLPLMIAYVPNGSTTNDSCDFWDVRPLINDREFAPANLARDFMTKPRAFFQADGSVGGTNTLTGLIEASINGRRVGGRLRRGTPGADADSIALMDAANQSTFTYADAGTWHLWLCFPCGLPRWARYTSAASGSRKPRSPRGIPLVTSNDAVVPFPDGRPRTFILGALQVGFLGTAGVISGTQAIHVASGFMKSSGGNQLLTSVGDGRRQHTGGAANILGPKVTATQGAGPNVTMKFTFTDNTHFPADARAILVYFDITGTTTDSSFASFADVRVYLPGSTTKLLTTLYAPSGYTKVSVPGAGSLVSQVFAMWIPISPVYPSNTGSTRYIEVDVWRDAGALITTSTKDAYVIGWELGP